MRNKISNQFGVSLVEIMVAMVISIFLLGGVVQVYLGNRTSYRFGDATGRIQENARFALETIASDIRMAGFWGCAQILSENDHLANTLNSASGNYKANIHNIINQDAVSGTENDGLNGSDSLSVIGSKPGQNIIKGLMSSDTGSIEVDEDTSIEANDMVIISDCSNADIFEVTSVAASTTAGQKTLGHTTTAPGSATPGNLKRPDSDGQSACTAVGINHCLLKAYGSDAAISSLQAITYSIQAGESGEPALWRSLNGVDEELIEGIEQMQLRFGIDTDGDASPNQYVISTAVADSNDIRTVRIFLVARSDVDNITDNFQKYTVDDTDITAADNRLRQVFSITVTLRNRAGIVE